MVNCGLALGQALPLDCRVSSARSEPRQASSKSSASRSRAFVQQQTSFLSRAAQPSCSARMVAARAATELGQEESTSSKVGGSDDPQTSRGFSYIHYEANSWEATFAKSGVTILVDPWLVGELVFYGQEWAFRGKKGLLTPDKVDLDAIANRADLVLLTQGLPDHAHKPTLERLPKDKPVVGSPAAARVASEMGFKQVYELSHGKSLDFADRRLHIRATSGALVGPPWSTRENGFIITETVPGGMSLYYEPHCDYVESSFADVDSVDAVITPVVDQIIFGAYPLVTGKRNILDLLKRLKPKVIVPLINAAFPAEGSLSSVVVEEGDAAALQDRLAENNLGNISVRLPAPPGTSMQVDL